MIDWVKIYGVLYFAVFFYILLNFPIVQMCAVRDRWRVDVSFTVHSAIWRPSWLEMKKQLVLQALTSGDHTKCTLYLVPVVACCMILSSFLKQILWKRFLLDQDTFSLLLGFLFDAASVLPLQMLLYNADQSRYVSFYICVPCPWCSLTFLLPCWSVLVGFVWSSSIYFANFWPLFRKATWKGFLLSSSDLASTLREKIFQFHLSS